MGGRGGSIVGSRTPESSSPSTARETLIAPELRVELVVRDRLGSITTLITRDGAVDAQTAAAEIARGAKTYITGPDSWVRSRVTTMTGLGGDYLYANWDGSGRNNLHELSSPAATRPVAVCVPERRTLRSLLRRIIHGAPAVRP